MKRKMLLLILASVVVDTADAQEAKVTPLMSKELKEGPGKEGLMIVVEYPPGSSDPIHRHNANAYVYVLEGSVVMQVKGGKQVTLTPGQTFYEGPDDIHVVGRNASSTRPAKMLVFLVKDKGAPVVIPVKWCGTGGGEFDENGSSQTRYRIGFARPTIFRVCACAPQ
jgi:quercetin dioxygenase-like cupin family protein